MPVVNYSIKVIAITRNTETVGKEWKQIKADEYGYTPEIEKVVEREVKVYEQQVETLDLQKVIAAVNGM